MDKFLEILEDKRVEALAEDMFGPDLDHFWDGYGDNDYPDNSKDAAWDDTFDSCWEK